MNEQVTAVGIKCSMCGNGGRPRKVFVHVEPGLSDKQLRDVEDKVRREHVEWHKSKLTNRRLR